MLKKYLTTDLLIVGGGTAGCYAAVIAARRRPDVRILIAEKANIRRSGCLAAGVNALNAYIHEGLSVQDYVDFVRWDAEEILREELVSSMAEGFNEAVQDLERMGLVILKDADGRYAARGRQNIKINGENIKPILAKEVGKYPNIQVLNHVNLTDLLTEPGVHDQTENKISPVCAPGPDASDPKNRSRKPVRVCGAVGLSIDGGTAYAVRARAVLVATGGAAGLYRPNNPGFSRHKMWYPPFNTGAGYAMGIRAGAEMTSFEMRFVAQRCKDTIAPTGTIALGVGAREINARGEIFEQKYGLSTSGRAYGATNETHEGRGPCYLRTEGISADQDRDLLKAYLNMAPAQTLKWIESGRLPSQQNVEIEGTEPYIVGGHTGSGFWIDAGRRTTLAGLYAGGDAAGGAPKKFVTGAMAEGRIAAETILEDLKKENSGPENLSAGESPEKETPGPENPAAGESLEEQAKPFFAEYARHLGDQTRGRCREKSAGAIYDVFSLEEAMQKVMDEYAGGIKTGYRYNAGQLALAQEKIELLTGLTAEVSVQDPEDLYRVYELRDRLTVCRTLLAHMLERRETRWPGFGIYTDHPLKEEGPLYFVNSILEDGGIHVFRRPIHAPVIHGERSDHTPAE